MCSFSVAVVVVIIDGDDVGPCCYQQFWQSFSLIPEKEENITLSVLKECLIVITCCITQILKQKKKKNYKIITHPLSPLPHPFINQPPPTYPIPPNICNNNTVDIEFLVQMRQSDKCGKVRNDDIFNLHLGSGAGPWVSIPCLLQDTSHIYWFHPPKQLTRKKQRIQKWDSTPNN